MTKGRLEAFSDSVISVIITVMVLEMKIPRGPTLAALEPMVPLFLVYLLSYIYIGIYWNNHHHLLHATTSINGVVLWANLHLMFWLSLIPFVTGWMGEAHYPVPTAVYGLVLLAAALSYKILQTVIIRADEKNATLRAAVGSDFKGWLSPVLYAASIPLAFVDVWISDALYVVVAMMWLIPDRRIESQLKKE